MNKTMHCTECHDDNLTWNINVDEFGDPIMREGKEWRYLYCAEDWRSDFYKTETAFCLDCNKEVKITKEEDLFIFVKCLECGNGEQQPYESPIHHLNLFHSEGWPIPNEDEHGIPLLQCATCNGKHIKVEVYDQNKND